MIRVYLDNCCFNRPYDNQNSIKIALETEAKMHIQKLILENKIELIWSYILDYENEVNPNEEHKEEIFNWKNRATILIEQSQAILDNARQYISIGIKTKDAIHIAAAIEGRADYLLTTDIKLIKKSENLPNIKVLNPLTFISEVIENEK